MFPDVFTRFGIRRTSIRIAKAAKKNRSMTLELFIVLLFAQFILGFPWVSEHERLVYY
jgi:hypothetical protein